MLELKREIIKPLFRGPHILNTTGSIIIVLKHLNQNKYTLKFSLSNKIKKYNRKKKLKFFKLFKRLDEGKNC